MIKKKPHKNLYKQRLHVKKLIKKVFKFNQIIFIIYYRNKQRLQVKKNIKKVFKSNQIIFIIQYRDVSYVQYRDVLIPKSTPPPPPPPQPS